MVVINETCIGCGGCIRDCVAENLVSDGIRVKVLGSCIQCGHCVAICPVGAVSIPEYDMEDVEETAVLADMPSAEQLIHMFKTRRTIRHYTSRPVEREVLEQLFQAGRYTATGKNAQDCRFLLVQEELNTLKDMVWKRVEETVAAGISVPNEPILLPGYQQFLEMKRRPKPVDYLFRNAPALLCIAADSPISASLAARSIELMAAALGLGIMYNGYIVRTINSFPELAKWLKIGGKRVQIGMLLGYPDITYVRTAPRKKARIILK